MLGLILLDMDGVVFEGRNFWLDLHHALGTADEAMELWERLGTDDYAELGRITATMWQGRPAAPYLEMIRQRPYVEGIVELVAGAAAQGIRTAIVSSGPWHLARRAQEELGIDAIRANRLGIDAEGRFDGTVELQVDDIRKDRAAMEVQRTFGVPREETGMVGDGRNDIPMTRVASVAVGYRVEGADERRHFAHHIDAGSVAPALDLLRQSEAVVRL